MNRAAEDIFLRNILLDAAAREFAEELHDRTPIATSAHFRRQMRSMVKNPARWARQRHTPLCKQVAQTAAAVLIACSLALGSVMAASPTARAAILEWVTEWYESSVIYRFFGEPTFESMPRYEIMELPTGYRYADLLELLNDIEIIYESELGDVIRLEYMRVEEGSAIVIDTENMSVTGIEIDGCPGHLYMSTTEDQSNCITWYDSQCNIQFSIDGFFDRDALIEMAESVSIHAKGRQK